MENLIGKKIITKNFIEGIIEKHEKDEIGRDVIRIKVVKGETAITDYFLKDVFPYECPITGLEFSGLVHEDDGGETPVYQFSPYTSYSLPWYDDEEKAFYHKVYDEDEGCWSEECQHFVDLEELEEEMPREKFEEVKAFYDIKG